MRGIRRAKELVEQDKRDGTVFGERLVVLPTVGLSRDNLALTRDAMQQACPPGTNQPM